MINKDSTRYKSNIQEKRIAKSLGGRQVIGSGSTPFLKGDVVTSNLFVEAKTKMEPSKSISVKKQWIEKAQEQAYSQRKEDYTVAISFGDGKDYYIIEDSLLEDLYKSREALRAVIDNLEGTDPNPFFPEDSTGNIIRSIIREKMED